MYLGTDFNSDRQVFLEINNKGREMVTETIEFIKKLDLPNMGMLIDTFHMNIEEVSIYESIIKAKDYITHVHLADSNRWAPGKRTP